MIVSVRMLDCCAFVSDRYTLAAISDAQKKLENSDLEHLNLLDQVLLTPGLSREDVLVFMMDFLIAGIDNVSFYLLYDTCVL